MGVSKELISKFLIANRFHAYPHCGEYILEYIYVQVWAIATAESRAQSADSSKVYGKPKCF